MRHKNLIREIETSSLNPCDFGEEASYPTPHGSLKLSLELFQEGAAHHPNSLNFKIDQTGEKA